MFLGRRIITSAIAAASLLPHVGAMRQPLLGDGEAMKVDTTEQQNPMPGQQRMAAQQNPMPGQQRMAAQQNPMPGQQRMATQQNPMPGQQGVDARKWCKGVCANYLCPAAKGCWSGCAVPAAKECFENLVDGLTGGHGPGMEPPLATAVVGSTVQQQIYPRRLPGFMRDYQPQTQNQ